jgi:hypothetical protein
MKIGQNGSVYSVAARRIGIPLLAFGSLTVASS